MTTAQKVALVDRAGGEFGLTPVLSALGLARSTWWYQSRRETYLERHADLVPVMHAVAREHPDYGYRRAVDEVSARARRRVNSKVVRRLSQVLGLTQVRKPRAPRKSVVRRTIDEAGEHANLVQNLKEIGLYEVLFTDFTELEYASGKAQLMPMLDAHSKDVVGWALGRRRCTELARKAWTRARSRLTRLGLSTDGLIIHHDRDSVYTSEDWIRSTILDRGVRLSYALRGARDNPEMESWNGRFKTENADLVAEAETFEELEIVVRDRIGYYCNRRRHSSLGNQIPRPYVRKLLEERE